MAYLLLICQLLLATVMLLAATGKMLNGEQFLTALRVGYVPQSLVIVIAVLTPAMEFCLAVGLVLSPPSLLPISLMVCTAVLVLFTGWMLAVSLRGLRVKCGCFGAGGADVGPSTIGRNIALIIISLGGLLLTLSHQSLLPAPSFWMVITVLSCCMSIMLLRALQQGKGALTLSLTQLEQDQSSSIL